MRFLLANCTQQSQTETARREAAGSFYVRNHYWIKQEGFSEFRSPDLLL